ncbi:hypothetical protein M514_05213, partial [Trichuris suis]
LTLGKGRTAWLAEFYSVTDCFILLNCSGFTRQFDFDKYAYVCIQPAGAQNGIFHFSQYYYNSLTNECEPILLNKGSAANANIFRTHCSHLHSCYKRTAGSPIGLCCPSRAFVCSPFGGIFMDAANIEEPFVEYDEGLQAETVQSVNFPVIRYYFSLSELKCKTFLFRGVGGNFNNFLSYEQCFDYCMPDTDQLSLLCPNTSVRIDSNSDPVLCNMTNPCLPPAWCLKNLTALVTAGKDEPLRCSTREEAECPISFFCFLNGANGTNGVCCFFRKEELTCPMFMKPKYGKDGLERCNPHEVSLTCQLGKDTCHFNGNYRIYYCCEEVFPRCYTLTLLKGIFFESKTPSNGGWSRILRDCYCHRPGETNLYPSSLSIRAVWRMYNASLSFLSLKKGSWCILVMVIRSSGQGHVITCSTTAEHVMLRALRTLKCKLFYALHKGSDLERNAKDESAADKEGRLYYQNQLMAFPPDRLCSTGRNFKRVRDRADDGGSGNAVEENGKRFPLDAKCADGSSPYVDPYLKSIRICNPNLHFTCPSSYACVFNPSSSNYYCCISNGTLPDNVEILLPGDGGCINDFQCSRNFPGAYCEKNVCTCPAFMLLHQKSCVRDVRLRISLEGLGAIMHFDLLENKTFLSEALNPRLSDIVVRGDESREHAEQCNLFTNHKKGKRSTQLTKLEEN